jgi:hypothetical protein
VTRPPLRLPTESGNSHRGMAWLIIGLMFLTTAIATITLAVEMGHSLLLIIAGGGELLAAVGCAAAAIRQRRN